MKKLLSGNEAVALGAYHAGVTVAAAYPGTPSTEILENLARFDGIYAEWSTNEKVAMEVGMGAAYGGARALVSMKHVGLNVASDPFFGASVTGINGGLVVLSADDPGMHSSQNEQDNRHYAKFAKVPMLEPADSQEAYELMSLAFQVSEDFDTPVLFRTTTRISHCKSVVDVPEGLQPQPRPIGFKRDRQKYVMVPSHARPRHAIMEERLAKLAAYSESFPHNKMIAGERRLGIVSSGVAFQYAREVFPDASFLKLAMPYPLPEKLVRRFRRQVDQIVVVEELDPFIEEGLRAMGIKADGKRYFPITGELSVETVRKGAPTLRLAPAPSRPGEATAVKLPARPPRLCPGCPHTAANYALKRLSLKAPGLVVTGDIGCYTLAVYPPLQTLDTTACMGASIGQALGLEKAGVQSRIVAVIGDSTFMHSGITPLVDVVYNQGKTTVIILDNGTTAMTGHQGHPATGVSARGEQAQRVPLEDICRGAGVKDVNVVDAFDLPLIESTIRRCTETAAPSVIIVRGDCVLNGKVFGTALAVDADICNGCRSCLRLGCAALVKEGKKVRIDATLCVGEICGVCVLVCPQKAIQMKHKAGAREDAKNAKHEA
ncbi:MAG: indolepyruvate ferredoxin oxidoreductase subunit alpha [Chloroflexi bacterium]|nr:indolepyruvate ferredoxin oxidoreductase subunit alpha [Chloroflexota bacterium]